MKKNIFISLFVIFCSLFLVTNVIAQEEEILDIVSGKITSVDVGANKLSIQDQDAKAQEFVLDPNLTTVWDDSADEEKELADLEKGKDVVVEFRLEKDGTKLASWIDIITIEEEKTE